MDGEMARHGQPDGSRRNLRDEKVRRVTDGAPRARDGGLPGLSRASGRSSHHGVNARDARILRESKRNR